MQKGKQKLFVIFILRNVQTSQIITNYERFLLTQPGIEFMHHFSADCNTQINRIKLNIKDSN